MGIKDIKAVRSVVKPLKSLYPPDLENLLSTCAKTKNPLKMFTMTQIPTPGKPEMVTDGGNVRCRFDMFTVKFPQFVKPGQKPEWTHRGDKYTDDPLEMLPSLLRMFTNHYKKYSLVELYDNTRPKSDPERIVMKYKDGVVDINRLADYRPMLTKIALPDYLKNWH